MFKKEANYYDIFHKNKNYTSQARKIRKAYPNAKTVLEIGSGTGLMTEALTKFGFEVTCIEPSKPMRRIAKINGRIGKEILPISIEDYDFDKKFDLVLALYDVFNYINTTDFILIRYILSKRTNNLLIETWSNGFVFPLTYRKVGKCRRLRLGFRFFSRVYLWYFYWGKGLVVEFHKLYLHLK